MAVVAATVGDQPRIWPFSVENRKRAPADLPACVTANAFASPLTTVPVGPPGTSTTSAAFAPEPWYSVDLFVPLSDTHQGVVGPMLRPQPLTRLESLLLVTSVCALYEFPAAASATAAKIAANIDALPVLFRRTGESYAVYALTDLAGSARARPRKRFRRGRRRARAARTSARSCAPPRPSRARNHAATDPRRRCRTPAARATRSRARRRARGMPASSRARGRGSCAGPDPSPRRG